MPSHPIQIQINSDLLETVGGIEVETLESATKLAVIDSKLLGPPTSILLKPLVDAKFPTDPVTKNLVFFRPDNETREDSPIRGDTLTAADLQGMVEKMPLTNQLQKPSNQLGTIGSNLMGINAPSDGSMVETTTGPETIVADAQPTFDRTTVVFGLALFAIAAFFFFGGGK